MMDASYIHIPAHELLRQRFCVANPIGTLIEDTRRNIAACIGRSAGAITPALKRLANDGWISYLSDGRGTLIEVLRTDQESDRSVFPPAPIAEPSTAPPSDESPIPCDQTPDRMFAASQCDQESDRSACMVDHDSCSNSSSVGAQSQKNDWSGITITGLDFLPIAALEKAGVTPQIVQDADRKIVTRREYDRPAQIRILIRSLLSGQPIYSASEIAARSEEHPHAHPARSATASGTRRRSHPNRPVQTADPALTPDAIAALVAEWERTEPLGPIAVRVPGQRRAADGHG